MRNCGFRYRYIIVSRHVANKSSRYTKYNLKHYNIEIRYTQIETNCHQNHHLLLFLSLALSVSITFWTKTDPTLTVCVFGST